MESMVLPNKLAIQVVVLLIAPTLCSPGVEIQIGTKIDVIHGIKH